MVTYIVIAYVFLINITAFILFGVDKKRAVNRGKRIPVWMLLWAARLGGGVGCWLGMFYFHHKKKHTNFQILIPLWIIIWMVILVLLLAIGDGNMSEEIEAVSSQLH